MDNPLLLVVIVAAQQEPDQKADADGDQQRLARVRAHVTADLIGDGAEIDVLHLLPHAVVLIAHRIRCRAVCLVHEILGPPEPRSRVVCATRCRAGLSATFIHVAYLLRKYERNRGKGVSSNRHAMLQNRCPCASGWKTCPTSMTPATNRQRCTCWTTSPSPSPATL